MVKKCYIKKIKTYKIQSYNKNEKDTDNFNFDINSCSASNIK